MRSFYIAYRGIFQTPSGKFAGRLIPLPWSHYVLLLKVEKVEARAFYEAEAIHNGWSVRQLDRQISTLFYERTLASRKKTAMLEKGASPSQARPQLLRRKSKIHSSWNSSASRTNTQKAISKKP